MIVELFGTPGAGKTSLVPVVSEFFKQQGKQAFSVVEAARPFTLRTCLGGSLGYLMPSGLRGPVLWQLFYMYSRYYRQLFYNQHTQLIDQVLAFQQKRPLARADQEHVLHWFIHHTGAYAFLKRKLKPDDVLIFDEGFVHRVVQLFVSEVEELDIDEMTLYLNLIPRPDLLIYVYSPGAVCVKRVIERGVWKRFQNKTRAETTRFVMSSFSAVQQTSEILLEKEWPVLKVYNGDPGLEQTKTSLKQQLAAWYQHQNALAVT